jgi:pyruvate kinase
MRDPNAKTMINIQLLDDLRRKIALKRKQVPELLVTMCPSFSHFNRFAHDKRVGGIRFNTAMITPDELDQELGVLKRAHSATPIYYDVKARQMRIIDIETHDGNLHLTLNHPIEVKTPCEVLFKAGADIALLNRVENDGHKLIFDGGPRYRLVPGESLHIRNKSFKMKDTKVITWLEEKKIQKAMAAGIKKYFLSYVEKQSDIDELQEIVGKDAEIWLKIESIPGMEFVNNQFKKRDNLVLVAARGDLFVEVDKPHHMIQALRQIIKKDPEACVGSRLLLSIVNDPVPSCADLMEIAWLYDIGYRRMMLCDEICLKENLLLTAVAVFDGIKREL